MQPQVTHDEWLCVSPIHHNDPTAECRSVHAAFAQTFTCVVTRGNEHRRLNHTPLSNALVSVFLCAYTRAVDSISEDVVKFRYIVIDQNTAAFGPKVLF